MIGINFTDFFTMTLIILLIYIAWLWMREIRRIRRNEWQLNNRRLFRCNKCFLCFVPKQPVSLCRCPRCNNMCFLKRSDALLKKDEPIEAEEQK
jgi:hypothetical protein